MTVYPTPVPVNATTGAEGPVHTTATAKAETQTVPERSAAMPFATRSARPVPLVSIISGTQPSARRMHTDGPQGLPPKRGQRRAQRQRQPEEAPRDGGARGTEKVVDALIA